MWSEIILAPYIMKRGLHVCAQCVARHECHGEDKTAAMQGPTALKQPSVAAAVVIQSLELIVLIYSRGSNSCILFEQSLTSSYTVILYIHTVALQVKLNNSPFNISTA